MKMTTRQPARRRRWSFAKIQLRRFTTPAVYSHSMRFALKKPCGSLKPLPAGGSMNAKRILMAAVAGFITFFIYGGLVFGKLLANDYRPYTNVYRSMDQMQHHMAVGILSSIIAMAPRP